MSRPTISVDTIFTHQTFDASTATDQLFLAGITLKGPDTPKRVFSIEEWRSIYGAAVSTSSMDVAAEGFFREGGHVLTGQRVTGSAPVKAFKMLQNAVPAAVLKVEALYYGSYANAITVQVIVTGGTFVLVIADAGGELERSPALADQAAAVAWGLTSKVVRVTAQSGTGNPVTLAATALQTGTDDTGSVTDANYDTALAKIDKRYGPGQVAMPGRTTPAAHLSLDTHCLATDRIPLKDFADGVSATTTASAALNERPLAGAGISGAFHPWLVTPDGRTCPPCAAAAAKMALVDLSPEHGPNQPAAGEEFGQLTWFTGVTQDFTEAERDTLADAGVNVIRDVDLQGTIQIGDYQTLTNPATDPLRLALSNVRLDMLVRHGIRRIGRSRQFADIDPKGHTASLFGTLVDAYIGSLPGVWGYKVNTGPTINTPATAAAQKLLVKVDLQRDQYARFVAFQLTIHALTEVLA